MAEPAIVVFSIDPEFYLRPSVPDRPAALRKDSHVISCGSVQEGESRNRIGMAWHFDKRQMAQKVHENDLGSPLGLLLRALIIRWKSSSKSSGDLQEADIARACCSKVATEDEMIVVNDREGREHHTQDVASAADGA